MRSRTRIRPHALPWTFDRECFDRYSLTPRTIPAHSATFIPVTRRHLSPAPLSPLSERIAR